MELELIMIQKSIRNFTIQKFTHTGVARRLFSERNRGEDIKLTGGRKTRNDYG